MSNEPSVTSTFHYKLGIVKLHICCQNDTFSFVQLHISLVTCCPPFQSRLRPACGRLVAFDAMNYHGVLPVLQGHRCSIALWFTLDARYAEAAHPHAHRALQRAGVQGPPQGAAARDEL